MLFVELTERAHDGSATAEFWLDESPGAVESFSLSMTADQWLELRVLLEDAAAAQGVGIDIRDSADGSPPAQ